MLARSLPLDLRAREIFRVELLSRNEFLQLFMRNNLPLFSEEFGQNKKGNVSLMNYVRVIRQPYRPNWKRKLLQFARVKQLKATEVPTVLSPTHSHIEAHRMHFYLFIGRKGTDEIAPVTRP
jgi:hypothetical protein